MQNKLYLAILLLCLLFAGCGRKTAGVAAYVQYLNKPDNGLVQQKEIDGLVFKAQLLTPELMALNEIKKTEIENAEWQRVYPQYKGLMYYKITIADEHGGHIYAALHRDGYDGNDIEAHLNFGGQKDLLVVSNTDTAACVLYSLSKTYGLAKQLDMAAAFENKAKPGNDYVLEFNAGFLNRGMLKFRFKRTDIDNIPALTI
ncbi:MAG: hypothetical protein RLZZ367_181 [Bacteroidota bacterium]